MKKRKSTDRDDAMMADEALPFDPAAELSDRERMFVASYIERLNASSAALAAGYHGNPNVLRNTAWRLLHRPAIRAAVDNHLLSVYMNASEMRARLSEIARASMEDFLDVNEETGVATFNLAKAKARGVLGLIKRYRHRETVSPKGERHVVSDLELYDAHAALVNVAKLHGLVNDPGGEPIGLRENPFEAMARAYQMGTTAAPPLDPSATT